MQQQCVSTVQDGWTLDIDNDCGALTANPSKCQVSYESSEDKFGLVLDPKSLILSENTKCIVKIDATKAVARVKFEGNNFLGVLYPGYKIGDTINVSKGNVQYVTIFNGGTRGEMTAQAVFSGAVALYGSMVATAASMLYLA